MSVRSTPVAERLSEYASARQDRLAQIIGDLVRIPSENQPPVGNEKGCQEYIARFLRGLGWEPVLYRPDETPGAVDHPLYWPGRDYRGRMNIGARRPGRGGGRSLVLSGHIDTVPKGTQRWTRDPFGGAIEGNRLYGRGANDMKAGVGTSLFVLEALVELNIELSGDLTFESVVDEEFGGSNGTLAGRLAGFNADAAVITEPSFLRVCPAQRGGRTAHITLRAPGGVLTDARFPVGVLDPLRHFLNRVNEFAERRKASAAVHPLYRECPDPVPVSITKVTTGPWGTTEPMTIPEECRIEFYWQAMPGESLDKIEREFTSWFDEVVAAAPHLFSQPPLIEFPIRWLPGSATEASHPLVTELAGVAAACLGAEPVIAGIEGPCDMFVFHEFGIPVALWGPRGGNTHAADEYVELDSAVSAAEVLLRFVCQWCGVAEDRTIGR